MVDLMRWEAERWAAKRSDSGTERICVKVVCRAWISWGGGVAKYEGFFAS